MNHVGIDVSSKELVMVVSIDGKQRQPRVFANTPDGHRDIIGVLSKLRGETRVCLEATGVHHFDVAVALSRAENIQVMVINPKVAHNFAKVLMQRSKTDRVDAGVLAVYCERMPFEAWLRPDDEKLGLRAIGRRIAATNKLKTQTKNQLSALKATAGTPKIALDTTEQLIKVLEEQIEQYRGAARQIIGQHPALLQAYRLITGIKGIADASAIQLLAELAVLPEFLTARQWAAYAGLDPRQFESGSSVSKKPRISKAGNKYVRQALYMPALVAAHSEPTIKAYYRHLIDNNGLKKLQALCAVMRKLLHAIHGMLRTQQPFEGRRFYAVPAETSA